jgi:hypothetical protein
MAAIGVAVSHAVEQPEPRQATAGEASLLGIQKAALVTHIRRTYYSDNGRPVGTADIVMPAAHCEIVYEIPINRLAQAFAWAGCGGASVRPDIVQAVRAVSPAVHVVTVAQPRTTLPLSDHPWAVSGLCEGARGRPMATDSDSRVSGAHHEPPGHSPLLRRVSAQP